ncbi:MAG: MFS transporter, partial [Deltaproteobacteria bacterium]|nr:MFS transporter [Deltaproteobacteria bacterium]
MVFDMVRESHKKDTNPVQGLILKVSVAVICRILFNTVRRFSYTFAAVLSRELGVPLTAITTLIAVNQATGILGLFFGPLADRFGYRMFMLLGLGMLAVGMLAGGLFPYYWVVMVALFLAGLGKNAFDTAIQGYFAHRVPFARRARIIGAVELGWAGSTLIGIPIVGLLMDTLGWRSFFFITGAMGVLGIFAMRALMAGESELQDSNCQFQSIGAALLHMSRDKTV